MKDHIFVYKLTNMNIVLFITQMIGKCFMLSHAHARVVMTQ